MDIDSQVEENTVESLKRDKAATENLLQETVEKHQAELAAQKEYYTDALTAAKEAEALAEARANTEARTELESRLREAEERESMLVQTLEELRQTLTRKEQQVNRDRFWILIYFLILVYNSDNYVSLLCRLFLEKICFVGISKIFKSGIK